MLEEKKAQIPVDDVHQELEVMMSQIMMKVFLLGMLVGKNQLQDDAAASGSPMASVLGQLQQQFDLLMPGSKQASEVNQFSQFQKNLMSNMVMNVYKKEQEKTEKVKIPNENLTPNDKRLNDQHDVIVRQLLGSLEDEMKETAATIVKDTKIFKK
jgi:hypothetical protein